MHVRRFGRAKAAAVFTVDVKTTAAYAAPVTGLALGHRKKPRAEALRFLRPFGKGRSASILLALHTDSIAGDGIAPALRYLHEAWAALTDSRGAKDCGRMLLSGLRSAWRHVAARPFVT